MKKTLALMLALVMVLAVIPAMAADTRTSGLYTYEIKGNGTITITVFDWKNNKGDVYIPNMIDGYTVTGIGDEAFAFEDKNYSPHSITLPEGIKSIGDKAFFNANIDSINLPASLQHIGAGAFYNSPCCKFKPTPNHPYFAVIDAGLYNKVKKELITYSWGNIGIERKWPDDRLYTISIPEGIQSLGAYSIAGMIDQGSYMEIHISLPTSLVSIGDFALAPSGYCWYDTLTGNLPNLKTIGKGAFERTKALGCDLKMPSVETIGDYAFSSCSLYTRSNEGYAIDFTGSPLKSIGNHSFGYMQISTSTDNGNYFKIPINKCSNIGPGNSGLGMLMTSQSKFSPELTVIPSELNPKVSSLPATVTAIESGAFTSGVDNFRLSTSLNDIAVDAFPKGSSFIVDAGSYAELWCSENGFAYSIEGQEDDLSWLN